MSQIPHLQDGGGLERLKAFAQTRALSPLSCEQISSRDRCLKWAWKELFGGLKALLSPSGNL